jgi:hypothetical protein
VILAVSGGSDCNVTTSRPDVSLDARFVNPASVAGSPHPYTLAARWCANQ